MLTENVVFYWAVTCKCGSVIPLKETEEASAHPRLKDGMPAFTLFCPHCGEIWVRADEIAKMEGELPEDFWPRGDLFAGS